MTELGVTSASDCCAVEHTNEGMRVALAVGLSNVIMTKNYYTLQDDFTGSAMVPDDLDKGSFCLAIGEFLKQHKYYSQSSRERKGE